MRRAVASVRLNMIEGSGKRTSEEFVSYLGMLWVVFVRFGDAFLLGLMLDIFLRMGRKKLVRLGGLRLVRHDPGGPEVVG